MENNERTRKGRAKLLLVLAICAAPLVASYVMYYGGFAQKLGRTNYGTLLDPRQYPIPPLHASTLDGKPSGLEAYQGKWRLIKVGPGACDDVCHKQLFTMRQLRLMQGKEMDRIERVWLVTDQQPVDTIVLREFDGMRVLRVDPAALARWLPVEGGEGAAPHLYLMDPLGNLILRFPVDPAPAKVSKDIAKVLKASGIG
ncbi:MAG: SCO family protein [Telluria sp.]